MFWTIFRMFRLIKQNQFVLLANDIFIVLIALYCSLLLQFDFKIPANVKNLISFEILASFISVKLFYFKIFHLYKGMYRYTSLWDLINILKANVFSFVSIIIFVFIYFGFADFSRSFFFLDLILCSILISFSRLGVYRSALVDQTGRNDREASL